MDFCEHLSYNKTINKKRRYGLLVYNQIILSLNQQQFGRFQTEVVGQRTQESIEEIGHHTYQEI